MIRIGVISNKLEQFEYSSVVYESLEVEELLTNEELKSNYKFLMIGDEHFDTVSESNYITRFDSLQMPIIFVDSLKGWLPFIRPITMKCLNYIMNITKNHLNNLSFQHMNFQEYLRD